MWSAGPRDLYAEVWDLFCLLACASCSSVVHVGLQHLYQKHQLVTMAQGKAK